MAQQDFDPDLNQFGRELRGLTPRACPVNRDAVMFRAGQASVPRNWLWPVATALSTCMAATFGAALLVQSTAQVQVRSVYVPQAGSFETQPSFPPLTVPEASAEEPVTLSEVSAWETPDTPYFHLQNDVLRWGLDGLPMPPPAAPQHTEKRDMLLRSF